MDPIGRTMYHYGKWDVYVAMLDLRELASGLSRRRIRGYGPDLLQLNRAASSMVVNLAEGARDQQIGRKLDRYRTALSSTSECNAVFTILARILPSEPALAEGRVLCERITAMLTMLIRSVVRGEADTRAPHRR